MLSQEKLNMLQTMYSGVEKETIQSFDNLKNAFASGNNFDNEFVQQIYENYSHSGHNLVYAKGYIDNLIDECTNSGEQKEQTEELKTLFVAIEKSLKIIDDIILFCQNALGIKEAIDTKKNRTRKH